MIGLQRCALIAAGCLVWAGVASAQDQTAFRYVQDVAVLDHAAPQAVAVPLDEYAWAALDDQAADLRVFDSEGQPVPYLLRRATVSRMHKVPKPVRVKVTDFQTLATNAVQVLLEVTDGEPSVDRLSLATPLKNFERRVAVEGERADGSWETLVQDALLYDYTRFMDVRSTEIDLPANQARRLRVTVDAVADEQRSPLTRMTQHRGFPGDAAEEAFDVVRRPFRIDRVTAATLQQVEQTRTVRSRAYPIDRFELIDDARARETLVDITLPRPPAHSLTLQVADDNFVREATVEVPVRHEGRQGWQRVASGRLYRVRLGGQDRESLTLSFAEQRVERLRVRCRHHDNPPLTVEAVHVRGPLYEVVFIAEPHRTYGLYTGASEQRMPVYDTAALLSAADTVPVPLASGPQRENPLWKAASHGRWRWLQSRWFFMGAMVAAVAALAVGVMRAVRQADA